MALLKPTRANITRLQNMIAEQDETIQQLNQRIEMLGIRIEGAEKQIAEAQGKINDAVKLQTMAQDREAYALRALADWKWKYLCITGRDTALDEGMMPKLREQG